MLEGYPLRKHNWKDWLALILTSSLVLQLLLISIFSNVLLLINTSMAGTNVELEIISEALTKGTVMGTLISLPLTLLMVHWLKIPLFNRKQLSKEESSFIRGLSKKDWDFLKSFIPKSYFIYYVGAIIINSLFTDTEAINQTAVEGLFDQFPMWIMFIMIVIIAPIGEELLFRGIVLFSGDRLETTWLRVIISAVLFGLIHMPTNIPSAYSYIGMGFIFAYASKRTQTVEAGIIYHFINNLIAFLALLAIS